MEPVLGRVAALGLNGRGRERDVDRHGLLKHFVAQLEAGEQTRVARHRPALQAEFQHVLHIGGGQNRHPGMDQRMFGLVRDSGGLAGVVVARHQQHTAVGMAARDIAVLEGIARTIHARTLAIPDREHAVAVLARYAVQHLRAPDRGGGKILVHARLEDDVGFGKHVLRPPQLHVVGAERRSAIARDEPGRVQPVRLVDLLLQQRQAHKRMGAAHDYAVIDPRVFVGEGYVTH